MVWRHHLCGCVLPFCGALLELSLGVVRCTSKGEMVLGNDVVS